MLPFTLQQLRILKAVATEKNFTKAARNSISFTTFIK